MQKLTFILTLFVLKTSFAQADETKFAHWLPSLQLNLFNLSQELDAEGIDTPEKIDSENRLALKTLKKFEKEESYKERDYSFTKADADTLMQRLIDDPVVGRAQYSYYDPTGAYGFCFGRATWVWLEAIRLGVPKENIKKIFLVGPMKAGGTDWVFHVATAIKSTEKFLGFFDRDIWYVIDSNFGEVISPEKFYETYAKMSTDKKLRVFVSDPQRVGAISTLKFGPIHYTHPHHDKLYNEYFQDLLHGFRSRVNYGRTKQCKYLF